MIRVIVLVAGLVILLSCQIAKTQSSTQTFSNYFRSVPQAAPLSGNEPILVLQNSLTKQSPINSISALITYNIKSYGAKGDGVTDDSAAFLKVFTACQSSPGVVFLPPGSFLINTGPWGTVTNLSGCLIEGAGPGATFIINHDTNFPGDIAINIGNANNSGIVNYPSFFSINTPTSYANTLTTTTPADAGNFSPGQDILVSGAYQGTNYPFPSFQTTVASANPSTGVIIITDNLPLSGSEFSQVQPISPVKNVTIRDLAILSSGSGNGSPCINFSTVKHVLIDNVALFGGAGGCAGASGAGQDVVIRNSRCFGGAGLTCNFDCTSSSQCSFENNFVSGFQGYYKFEGGTFQSRMVGNVAVSFLANNQSSYYVASRSQANILTNNSAIGIPVDLAGVTIDGGGSNEGNNIVDGFYCSGVASTPGDCIQLGLHVRSDNNIVSNVRGDNIDNVIISNQGSQGNQVSGIFVTNAATQLSLNGGSSLGVVSCSAGTTSAATLTIIFGTVTHC